jgi:hypothetical protein
LSSPQGQLLQHGVLLGMVREQTFDLSLRKTPVTDPGSRYEVLGLSLFVLSLLHNQLKYAALKLSN